MGTMVRINEDNYVAIKKLADYDSRSVTNMTNRLLDKALGRDTGGEPNVVLPNNAVHEQGVPQKSELPEPFNRLETDKVSSNVRPDIPENKIEATPDVSDLFAKPDADDIIANNRELACCTHPSRPCKHWVWDTDRGDGYRNTLSGRFREAD